MHEPAFDYSRTYAEMSDNELLAIAGDSTSLTTEALAALQAEIEKRHLRKGPQAEDQQLATDNYWAWKARLESKLNSPRMTFLLPPWRSAEADEDLRILLGNHVVGGWIAVFASQFIIGGLFGGLYYLWVTVRLTPGHSSSHLSQVLAAWMPIDVALCLVYISPGLALWNKWSFAVKLARGAFVATVLNTIILGAVVALIGFLSRPATSVLSGSSGPLLAPDVNLALRQVAPLSCFNILYGVAGLLYLSRSRRARLTYPDGSAPSQTSPARPNSECNHVK